MIYEEKLTQTEGDDDIEIREQRDKQGGELEQLREVIETIGEDIETIKR
jgi:hypothetical protein